MNMCTRFHCQASNKKYISVWTKVVNRPSILHYRIWSIFCIKHMYHARFGYALECDELWLRTILWNTLWSYSTTWKRGTVWLFILQLQETGHPLHLVWPLECLGISHHKGPSMLKTFMHDKCVWKQWGRKNTVENWQKRSFPQVLIEPHSPPLTPLSPPPVPIYIY